MSPLKRSEIAQKITARLSAQKSTLITQFQKPGQIPSFILDDLLEESLAKEIYAAFPSKDKMVLRNSIRERKYVAVQMNQYNPLLEEIIYAFQDPAVLRIISEITGLKNLLPDEKLYAGGLSLMAPGDFLNPHLDNSHDLERKNYRVLNLLYYVSPDWKQEYGGNLELWDQGPSKTPRVLESRFNRLVVMLTGRSSWHSVNKNTHSQNRCCVSNYYFSPNPALDTNYFHVTSFRGRPEEPLKDWALRCDSTLRNGVRLFFKRGIVKTFHTYQK